MREDRASFREEVGEELDRIRRDVTWTLWMTFSALGVYVTLITFLALHLLG